MVSDLVVPCLFIFEVGFPGPISTRFLFEVFCPGTPSNSYQCCLGCSGVSGCCDHRYPGFGLPKCSKYKKNQIFQWTIESCCGINVQFWTHLWQNFIVVEHVVHPLQLSDAIGDCHTSPGNIWFNSNIALDQNPALVHTIVSASILSSSSPSPSLLQPSPRPIECQKFVSKDL